MTDREIDLLVTRTMADIMKHVGCDCRDADGEPWVDGKAFEVLREVFKQLLADEHVEQNT